MPEKDSRHLLDRLAKIEDPRNEKGKRHPLNSLLGLNIIGFMTGHKGWTSTAKWARSQPDLVQALGWTHKTSPCSVTIHNVIKKLDVYEKSHGKVETRCLKASTSLNAYLNWPGIAQVIQYRYIHKNPNTGEETTKVNYGRTNLTPEEVSSTERLLELRPWALVNREQIALDTRYSTWRRRIAYPMWCYSACYGGNLAKCRISSIEICWRSKYSG